MILRRSSLYYLVGLLSLVGFVAAAQPTSAALGDTSTFMSKQYTGDGGDALEAYLDMPHGFVVSGSGNFYIADTFNNVIRRISTSNIVTTFAGTGEYGLKNGLSDVSQWAGPKAITTGSDGLYVADTANHKIRKIKDGNVSTLAIAGLLLPTDLLVEGSTVYVVDTGNNRVVKVNTDGSGLTVLASGLNQPFKMVKEGNFLYVTEFGAGNIKKINISSQSASTLDSGYTQPRAITFVDGFVYITAGPNGVRNQIWKINPDTGEAEQLAERIENDTFNSIADMEEYNDRLYMLASGGSSIYSVDLDGQDLQQHAGNDRYGNEEGSRTTALTGRPQDLILSPDGTKMYIAYAQGNKVGTYNFSTGQFEFLAGWVRDSYTEGTGDAVRMSDVVQMAISPNGNTLYLIDRNNNRVRKLDTRNGTTTYLTGAGQKNADGSVSNGYREGGPCDNEFDLNVSGCAYFNRPTGIALSIDGGTLYVADNANNRIRSVNVTTGQTALIAGSGAAGFTNGVGSAATFNGPYTLALSPDGRVLYVADKNNHAIRSINLSTRQVGTVTGRGTIGYREGTFADAVLAIPEHIKFGPDGALYLSEAGSFRVRRLDFSSGRTSLISGSGDRGIQNGSMTAASWDAPKGLAFRGQTAYVADFRNDLIRAIDLTSVIGPLDQIASGASFFAYSSAWRGEWNVAVGNVFADSAEEIITGTGPGFGPEVKVFDGSGAKQKNFLAYAASDRSGVRVAACDFGSFGKQIVTIPGPGGLPTVRRFNSDGTKLGEFTALDGQFRGGANVACGDVNGDGVDDIIIGAGRGGGPQVTVHRANGAVIANFFAYNKDTFRYGVRVAAGDTDSNGTDEIITGPEVGAPHIQFFSLRPGLVKQLNPGFYAFSPNYRGGVSLATVDADGDGRDEFMVGVGLNAQPHVKIYNKIGTRVLEEYRPFPVAATGGVNVAAGDVDGDGRDEYVHMPRSGGGPQVKIVESGL